MAARPPPINRRRFLGLGAAAGAALFASGLLIGCLRPSPRTLGEDVRPLIDAIAVTMYPGNPGPPGDAVGVAEFVERYLADGVEPGTGRLLHALLAAIEWGAVLACAKRFTRADRARREAFLRALEAHPWGPVRSASVGLKSIISMAYFDHPDVLAAAGVEMICASLA